MKFDFSGAQKGEAPPEDGLNWKRGRSRLVEGHLLCREEREGSSVLQEEKGV